MENNQNSSILPMFYQIKDDSVIEKMLFQCINYIIQLSGTVANETNSAWIAEALLGDIRETNYKYLTIEEVKYAMKQGVLHRYGDYFGINVASISKWLDTYLESDKRKDYVASRQKYIDSSRQIGCRNEISAEEQDKIILNGIKERFEAFCRRMDGVSNENDSNVIDDDNVWAKSGILTFLTNKVNSISIAHLKKLGKIRDGETLDDVFLRWYKRKKNDEGKEG